MLFARALVTLSLLNTGPISGTVSPLTDRRSFICDGCCALHTVSFARQLPSTPKHPMPPLLQRLRHRPLPFLRLFPR
jgi:hypothetical protein